MIYKKNIENETKGNIVMVHCLECKRSTRHLVMVSLDKKGSETNEDEGWHISWSDRYQIVECQGCETISFRHEDWFSESDDIPTERIYPLRNKNAISPHSYQNVPLNLRRIYKEVIDCYNNDNQILCAAGLRALVEGVCADQGISDGPIETIEKGGGVKVIRRNNLEGRISGLQEKGVLTQSSASSLHQHRYLGNEVVHELSRPSIDELKIAIEIIEHVLEHLYELPERAAQLHRAMIRRKK